MQSWFKVSRYVYLCFVLSFTLVPTGSSAGASARFSVDPDNSQELLLSTLRPNASVVLINTYDFHQAKMVQRLVELIGKGAIVQILVEGQPVGGIGQDTVDTLRTLQGAMDARGTSKKSFIRLMTRASATKRRYRYDHAKYIVVDSRTSLISTDNFVEEAFPDPGRIGYRGWQVVLDDVATATTLKTMFDEDADESHGDVIDFQNAEIRTNSKPSPVLTPRRGPTLPPGGGTVERTMLVTSPQSLDGLLEIVRDARSHLEVEMMSLPYTWKSPGQAEGVSPIVAEIVKAARAGVSIRVLLNDESMFQVQSDGTDTSVDGSKTNSNEATAWYLTHLRRCENLPIEARIVNLKEAGLVIIHNKGFLADDRFALVSSINGTQTSVMNNRELGILLDSPDAARYFEAAFNADWNASPPSTESSPCQ
jgi:cardiolipin synthase A/B